MRPEQRVDPITGRVVVVAPGRAGRPGASVERIPPPGAEELERCPFCEGREASTPPEALALPPRAPADGPGWQVRVVPNLYPAFERQEVVVHAPRHARAFADLAPDELGLVAEAWAARGAAARGEGFAHVRALLNEGRAAGASLAHSHSQLVWLRDPPPADATPPGSGDGCALCRLLAAEAGGALDLEPGAPVRVLAHPAGRAPYELLVAPAVHEPDGLASPLLAAALRMVARWAGRLREVEGHVPWNAWLAVSGSHWRIELVPRLTVFAGIELGSGIWVNPLAPEQAAARLRAG